MTALSVKDRQAIADAIPFWWHSIDLGGGAVSRGRKSPDYHRQELARLDLPDLEGKRVIDIGASDGFYSFHAEQEGASQVTALDLYGWTQGAMPPPPVAPPQPLELQVAPHTRGFDAARYLRDSEVQPFLGDFMTADLSPLGRFDIALFLGVLYHLDDPVGALRRLRALTREVAVIETHGIVSDELEDRALWEFYPSDELLGDPTNWWGPNVPALAGACLAAGFDDVKVTSTEPTESADGFAHCRLVAHALVTSPVDEHAATIGSVSSADERAVLRVQRDQAKDESDFLRAQVASVQSELASVLASPSWRVTAPLRAVRRRLEARRP